MKTTEPNQSLVPTTAAVTDHAAHAPRHRQPRLTFSVRQKKAMPLSFPGFPSLLSDRDRTPEQKEARVEALRVMIPLSYGTMILAALTAGSWFSSLLFSKGSGSLGTYIAASAFAFLAVYSAFFIKRAKRIVEGADQKNEN